MDIALASSRAAYLVREGVNPGKNYVEVLDLRRGQTHRVKPASGFAILGFTLAANQAAVTYTEMNLLESRSRRAHWRSGFADLDTDESRSSLTLRSETRTGEGIPVPFGWSPVTGEIYFQGLLPFRGMTHGGIWAMKPDGTGLRALLPETEYVERPQLSPNGNLLAYLSTDVEALPANYIPPPGVPPGNVLVVMNLTTGEKTRIREEPGAAFGCLRWSAGGNKIVVGHREWRDGRFRDLALLTAAEENHFRLIRVGLAPSSNATVTDIGECQGGPLLWVEKENEEARLRSDRNGATLLALSDGDIRLVGCLGRNSAPAKRQPGDQRQPGDL